MGLKKGRRVRKIEVPSDSVPEFELWDTTTDIQWRREERDAREREESQKQREGRPGGRRQTHILKRRELQKNGPEPRKVTQKQRLEERWDHHSHDTRQGT